MGITKKIKKTAKSTAKAASSAKKQVTKVANTPIVKTAVTAVATTVGGPAGAQMVDNVYSVINSENPMDAVIGSVSPQYLETKNQYKDQSKGYVNQFKDQSSPLSTLMPASSGVKNAVSSVNNASKSMINVGASVSSPVRKKSFFEEMIDGIFSFFGF